MKVGPGRSVLLMLLCLNWLIPPTAIVAQSQPAPVPPTSDLPAPAGKGFSRVFSPYMQREISGVALGNSPRIETLIRDGKLNLTLSDAIALALENNLDIAVQRYIPRYAQTDVLRTLSGQAARGFSGVSIPSGLSAGAIGAGVSGTGTGSGVGSAGGITGGGGAVSVGPSGNFDPSLNMNFSWDRATSPLNTIVVSGIPNVTGQTTAYSSTYAQLFPQGASYSLALSAQRQSSTQSYLRFNPAIVSRFSFGFNQPLLAGFGRESGERFIRVARNNIKIAEEVFRQQVVTTVVLVQNTYWDLASLQENVRVAEQSLAVAEQLFKDNQVRLEVGTMSPLDVTSAESEVAARRRDLTLAQTNLQVQEAALKNILTKQVSPELGAARVVLLDKMPEPANDDVPAMDAALDSALKKRPDLQQSKRNLQNNEAATRYTANSLMPNTSIFGFYAGSGLQGVSATGETGLWDALADSFKGSYPEYAGGLSFTIALRNRQAQADNLRAQYEGQQLQVGVQRLQNQIALEVRKAMIGIVQGKAQVAAAHEAVRLAQEIYDGERNKLDAGVSTSYQVILRERDLVAARQAEVLAVVGYAKAMVERDRAMGTVLERNGIEYSDALSGTVTKMPVTPFTLRKPGQEVK